MKHPVLNAAFKLFAEAVLVAVVAGIIVAILGQVNHWVTSIQYSNAFFFAGCLVIVAGTSSRLVAGQEWGSFQGHMESFRDMSPGERAEFIVKSNSPARLVLLGLTSGILLIIISAIVPKLFPY